MEVEIDGVSIRDADNKDGACDDMVLPDGVFEVILYKDEVAGDVDDIGNGAPGALAGPGK